MNIWLKSCIGFAVAALVGAAWLVHSNPPHPTPTTAELLGAGDLPGDLALAIVRHRWQVKIAESNHVTIRPGSLYDIVTYFEQNAGFPKPRFNYLFLDLGLGAADPLYPVFQRGQQATWAQLLPAMWSDTNRHIDHTSLIDTPEGCRVHSTYWVRHIDEFPGRYNEERAAGYTLVDISFNHYERLKPDAQCGRHASHARDETFDPRGYIGQYARTFRSPQQIPAEMLARYEAKIGLLKLVSEEFDRARWPRFKEVYDFADNSLWYYPDGIAKDYGVVDQHRQSPGLAPLRAGQLLFPATAALQSMLGLGRVLQQQELDRIVAFVDGRPSTDFRPSSEPGNDALSLGQISKKHFYTAGLNVIPLGSPDTVRAHLSNLENFELVSVVARPYQKEEDPHWPRAEVVPQLRLVYQLHAALQPPGSRTPVEQFFLHLNFDAIDRRATRATRDSTHKEFLAALAEVGDLPRATGADANAWAERVDALAQRFASGRIQTLSFSSALTGIWVFGALTRAHSADGTLAPLRIRREGIDVGYYSTAYDTVLFREAAATASGKRRERLLAHLDALSPHHYRDPRRSDPKSIRFERMTCAQCHQMAARDAVHIALNDGLDRRFSGPARPTEFVLRELDRQLRYAPTYWSGPRSSPPAFSERWQTVP